MKLSTIVPVGFRYLDRFFWNKLCFYKPFFAQWEITYKCNLRCVFCNVYKDRSYDKTELDTKGALRLLRDLKKAGIIFLNFTGGEPLLRPDIPIILRYAKKLGFLITMNCNATLLKKKINLVKNYIDTIHLSLDSDSAKTYEKLRGVKGVFNLVLEGIDIAKSNGIHVGVNMTVTKENFNEMEKVCKLIKNKDVDLFLTIVSEIPTEFNDDTKTSEIMINRLTYYKKVNYLKQKYPFLKTSNAYLKFVRDRGFDNYPCKVMNYMLNIKPDGSIVLPCGYFPFKKFNGNILKIIKSKEFQKQVRVKKYPFCKNCTLSCNFIPTALMDITKIPSLLRSYL